MKNIYRPEIDGLRALAVLGVIFYHSEYLPGGFLGVDIFFVISGYLITSIIYKEYSKTKKFSFINFYQKRIRRLIPALLFVVFFTTIIAYSLLLPGYYKEYIDSAIYSFFFSSNIYFHYSGQAYGANILSIKPLLHTWSLGIEEQFYLIYPIFFILVARKYFKKISFFLIFIFIISIFFSLFIGKYHNSFNFYMLPSRAWELLSGGILAIYNLKVKKKTFTNSIYQKVFSRIGLILIFFSFFNFKDAGELPLYYSIFPVIGCCLIIHFNQKNDLIIKFLSNKILVGIGLISYSLYLWHHPILSFDKILNFSDGNIFIKLGLILVSIILAIFTYLFIEKPFRNKNFYSTKKLVLTLLIIIPLFLVIFLMSQNRQKEKFPNIAHDLYKKTWFKNKQFQKPCFQRKKYFCSFNNKGKDAIFLMGNSVMASIQEELKNNLTKRNIKFIPMTRSAGNDLENFKYRKEKILKNKNSTIIFYFGYSSNHEKLNIFIDKIKFFLKNNYKIILLYPIPEFKDNISEVIERKILLKNLDFNSNYINISYEEYINKTELIFRDLDKISHKNLFKVYPHLKFCDTELQNKCIAHNKKNIFFIDQVHLSQKGSELINMDLTKVIDKIYK